MLLETNNKKENLQNYHIPRWEEIPNIDLYLDQVVSYLETYLSNFINNDISGTQKAITKTMINNYVKNKVIKPPISKKYNKEHLAYLFVIFILKQLYSMEEIKKLLDLAIRTSPIEISYNKFCNELENAINTIISRNYNHINKELSNEQYLLRTTVFSIANKLYVQKSYLNQEKKS